MVKVTYSYEYDEDIGTFLYKPTSNVGLHGMAWPRFIITNGDTIDAVWVTSPQVGKVANEIAMFMNRYYSKEIYNIKAYATVLSCIASKQFNNLLKKLVNVESNNLPKIDRTAQR